MDKGYKGSNKKTIVHPDRALRVSGVSNPRKVIEKSNNTKKAVEKSSNDCLNKDKNQVQAISRTLRSHIAIADQPTTSNLRRKASSSSPVSSVIPKKRQRVFETSHQQPSVSRSGAAQTESTGSGVKALNLGARLARNQSGREPLQTQPEDTSNASNNTSFQQTGHPPQNLLRRSSRSKGASSSSTTGSCVSLFFNIHWAS